MKQNFINSISFLFLFLLSFNAFSERIEYESSYCPITDYIGCDSRAGMGIINGVRVLYCTGGAAGGSYSWRYTHYPSASACAPSDNDIIYYINNSTFDDFFSDGKFAVYRGNLVLARDNPECIGIPYCVLDILLLVIRENYMDYADDDLSDDGYGNDLNPCSDYEDCERYAENEANCPADTTFSFDYYEKPSYFEYSCSSNPPPPPSEDDDDAVEPPPVTPPPSDDDNDNDDNGGDDDDEKTEENTSGLESG